MIDGVAAAAGSRRDRATVSVAVVIALVAFLVRIGGALHFAFWQDEVGSARAIIESTPLGVARHVARSESQPPGFFVLGWVVHRLGFAPAEVRVASVVAGAVLSGGLVLYARRLVPLRIEKYAARGLVRRIDASNVVTDDIGRHVPANLTVRGSQRDSVTEIDGSRIKHDVTYADGQFIPEALKEVTIPRSGAE